MGRAAEQYSAAVVEILARHVPGWGDYMAPGGHAGFVRELVARQFTEPKDSFEVVIGDPCAVDWRLLPSRADRRRVHLYCYGLYERPDRAALEHAVNDLLDALSPGQ